MRVLFLTKYYPPAEGGIERYGHLLCRGLAAHQVRVDVVAFAADRGRSRTETIDTVQVHRLTRNLHLGRVPFSSGLPSLLRRLAADCDLVHLNFPNPWMELCHLVCPPRRPTVLSYHSDVVRNRLLHRLYLPLARHVLGNCRAIIASSPAYLDSSPLLWRYRQRCTVIPYPVDTSFLQAPDNGAIAAARARYGAFVLFVGRLVYYKGLRYLIEAIGQLRDVRLVVVGRGPEEHRCHGLVAALGLSTRVAFLGMVGDSDLRTLYHAAECFVLPSVERSEAFGIVLAEAMACGRPVISTELGTGTSYVNLDGQTGFVVPPRDVAALADRIARLRGREDLRAELGLNARRRAETFFRQDIVVDHTLGLYDRVLAGGVL